MTQQPRLAFDVAEADARLSATYSGFARDASKFAQGQGQAVGKGSGPDQLRGSLARMGTFMVEAAHHSATEIADVADYLRQAPVKEAAAAVGEGIAGDITSFRFRTRLFLMEFRAGAKAMAVQRSLDRMAKFVSGATIRVVGEAKRNLPVALAIAVVAGGAATTVLINTGPASSSDGTNLYDLPIQMIPYRSVSAHTGPAPSPAFTQEALQSLTEALGSEAAAEKHLQRAMDILDACRNRYPVSCVVETGPVVLNPAGRYAARLALPDGAVRFAVELDGQLQHLDYGAGALVEKPQIAP